jgi:AraC-like DNA-binding protein
MVAQKSKRNDDPRVKQVLKELAGSISKALDNATDLSTEVPGLALYRNTAPTAPNPCTYKPSLLLIPQGKKRVDLGKQSYVFGESTFLLTSIELPIVSQVSVASPEKPYLAFFLKLDMQTVRDVLHTEEVRISAPPVGTSGMVLGEVTVELLTPCSRMVQLLDTPQDVPFFSKLLQREIIYRLLQGPQGDRLRSVATLADQNYRTAKAVTWLRENFEKTLNVEELASVAGMSRSTLHHHFRGLTAMSPLQFQKQLRLHAARQKMLTGELDAASAAFEDWIRKPKPVQSGVQALLRTATDARHTGTPRFCVIFRFSASFRLIFLGRLLERGTFEVVQVLCVFPSPQKSASLHPSASAWSSADGNRPTHSLNRVQISKSEQQKQIPQNLPLHPTQFATLEIEIKNKRHPNGGVFSFSGAHLAEIWVSVRAQSPARWLNPLE